MKKIVCLILLFSIQITPLCADSYCVMIDGDNNVVEEKDMHKTQSVASISKIMTAVLAIEQDSIDDNWVCGKELEKAYGSMIYLKQGQKVSLRSLLYGLLLRSGNDAALEIATHIAKNEKAFVKLMNQKAKEIGMLNTVFHNASGLDEEDGGNISSAYDMAVLMSYAMKNKTFRTITKAKYYTSEWNYRWKNKNRLLFDFPYANGGKTGFTKQAGRTLITTAKNNGIESIVVTLQTSDDFQFHQSHHQYVFDHYTLKTLLPKGNYTIDKHTYKVEKPIVVSLNNQEKNTVQVSTHLENKEMIVEVNHNKNTALYSFPVLKASS